MHLVLFFSRGVSLGTWASVGMMEREIAIYLRLQEKGFKVSFVTYGDGRDLEYAEQLGGIEILCNRWGLPQRVYEHLIPFLHAGVLRRADVYKTNQTNGADVALRAARIWRKPLVARCGYMWSLNARRRGDPQEVDLAGRVEQRVFEKAQRVVVTTDAMREYIGENYAVELEKVRVIPNYVLTDLFSPGDSHPDQQRLCFVGRLSEEKNLSALLQACQGLPVVLHFVGDGHLRMALQEEAVRLGVDLVLHGNLPHPQLPEIIRQSAVFALVSHYEGHPKAMLEAMSCGAAVLAADSPGIREHVVHGETGWLVPPDAEGIRGGLQRLLGDPALREKLGRNARRFILETCSLDKVAEMEYALLRETAK